MVSPALLSGTRCYVDASSKPDHLNTPLTTAGIGVFILNLQAQPTQTIYIKARLMPCTYVLMAEATSLALASALIQAMNINTGNYLSDCEQLVNFLNTNDLSNPPDWRIKPFTQAFSNYISNRSTPIFKISRRLNTTADALARQSFSSPALTLDTHCSYERCPISCSVIQVLQSVDLPDVTILAARCR